MFIKHLKTCHYIHGRNFWQRVGSNSPPKMSQFVELFWIQVGDSGKDTNIWRVYAGIKPRRSARRAKSQATKIVFSARYNCTSKLLNLAYFFTTSHLLFAGLRIGLLVLSVARLNLEPYLRYHVVWKPRDLCHKREWILTLNRRNLNRSLAREEVLWPFGKSVRRDRRLNFRTWSFTEQRIPKDGMLFEQITALSIDV